MKAMTRWAGFLAAVAAAAALGICPPQARAFNQPPYNLGLTNALDGAIPGPGIYLMAYSQFYFGNKIEVNGDVPEPVNSILTDTDITTLAAAWQIAWISKQQLLGAFLGWNIVIPVVVLDSKGDINGLVTKGQIENTGGLGDIITGPVIQWSGKSLFGRPYFHRIELDVIAPTGKYSEDYLINPGANIVTFNPYYAFTLFPTPKTDFSMRIHYAWNSTNESPYLDLYGPDASLQPGQNFHFNYTLQQNLYKTLWAGISGYCMWQLSDDDLENPGGLAAAIPGMAGALVQKEKVFSIGPILSMTPLKNLLMSWASAWEMGAENRPEGFKTTFKILYGF
jgi:anthranilate 1,2-dioxygenase (deaminating, decarboxylating) large subunit